MKKIVNGHKVKEVLDNLAPKKLAEDWDNVGLLVGSLDREVKKVLITLDVTDKVVDEAIEKNVDFIISHHPLIFKPLKNITTNNAQGKLITKLIKNDISVFTLHTNLDNAKCGVNSWLAEKLKLVNSENLTTEYVENYYKLVVYVPKTHIALVTRALGDSGAGSIGEYSHCTFKTEGVGEFLPLENSNAYIGNKNELTTVEEVKIETLVSDKNKNKVLSAMKKAHPYEEVAYDLYKVEQNYESFGLGKIGYLENEKTLEEFAYYVKNIFNMPFVKLIGKKDEKIKKVAVLGGSGSSFINVARIKGADVYVTGDVTYHTALDAKEENFNIIDAGHYIERVMVAELTNYLKENITEIEVVESVVDTHPYDIII